MSESVYTIGSARRFIAGSIWTAKKENQGKLPCLLCRGRGTVGGPPAIMCPQCKLTGYEDLTFFQLWFKFWVLAVSTTRGFDDALFHGGPALRSRGDSTDDGEGRH